MNIMDVTLTDRAIKSALTQNWREAIRINLAILAADGENVETLNRLAFAQLKLGNLTSAKSAYKKVLRIDKYNPIALKNLKWLTHLTKKDFRHEAGITPTPTIFLEEPGKTKIVTLIHPAPARVLCNLMTAQKVTMVPKTHSIEVRNIQGKYIGVLPDDLAHRLRLFISGGNTYDVYIKNIEKNTVSVFIRELKRGKKFIRLPSFSHSISVIHQSSVTDGTANDKI